MNDGPRNTKIRLPAKHVLPGKPEESEKEYEAALGSYVAALLEAEDGFVRVGKAPIGSIKQVTVISELDGLFLEITVEWNNDYDVWRTL